MTYLSSINSPYLLQFEISLDFDSFALAIFFFDIVQPHKEGTFAYHKLSNVVGDHNKIGVG